MQKFNQQENYNDDLAEIVTTATKIINHSDSKKNTSYDKSKLVMVYLDED